METFPGIKSIRQPTDDPLLLRRGRCSRCVQGWLPDHSAFRLNPFTLPPWRVNAHRSPRAISQLGNLPLTLSGGLLYLTIRSFHTRSDALLPQAKPKSQGLPPTQGAKFGRSRRNAGISIVPREQFQVTSGKHGMGSPHKGSSCIHQTRFWLNSSTLSALFTRVGYPPHGRL